MKTHLAAIFALFSATAGIAEPTKSSFFTNDFFGDGRDRWRSASYTLFLGFGGEKTAGISHDFRARAEIISPWGSKAQLNNDDRPYVGMLGFGVFANDRYQTLEYNIGAEVLFVGDQTYIADFQQSFHEVTGIAGYLPRDMPHKHVGNKVTGMASAEFARSLNLSDSVDFRPFLGLQAGYETFGRMGFDLIVGGYSGSERYVRDPVSGFLQPSSPNRSIRMEDLSFLIGADYTYITRSEFFPTWSDVEMTSGRARVRVGLQSQVSVASVFFGLTYFTKEFETQYEDQTIGVLSFEFPF
ncbi:lipid A-modifier LpxR family protein [Ruegeria atlantica]|uniref:lipid A-modifier LpxR family protein n=1 Tax=Ruegeria atlantica TaxID=81569 RepID=UPI00147D578E|nr:lipid A-modifier LpxR family protein [Ruegeria atlantica]